MRRKDVIYCSYCGEKNNVNDILCKKCHKKIKDKDHLFKEYLKNHIKSDVEDNIFSLITNFIKGHMYGTLITLTVIFSLSTVIVNKTYSAKNYIPEVSGVVSKCSINIVDEVLGCNEGYELRDEICVKKEEVNAKYEKVCSTGYTLKNNKCISNEKFTGTYKDVCEIPKEKPEDWGESDYNPNHYNLNAYVDSNGECILDPCADRTCPMGWVLEIPYTKKLVCPDNTENINDECRKTNPVLDKYSCSEGSLNDKNKCEIEIKEDAIKKCPENSVFNEYCNKCIGE